MELHADIIDLEFDHTETELTNEQLKVLFIKEIDDFKKRGT